jgi:hypothetical protein
VHSEKLHVIEWKFGRNPVPAAFENVQGATYALAAMQRFDAQECTVHIFQPRLSSKPTSHTFTDAGTLLATIEGIIARCEAEDAPLIAGENQCRYCKGKQICPAYRSYVEKPMMMVKAENLAPVAKWTDDELGEFRRRCGLLEKFKAIVDAELKTRISEPGKIVGGYTLTKPRRSRVIEDVGQAYTNLSGLVTAEEFASACKVGWTSIVEVVAKKHGLKGTEAGKRIEASLGAALAWRESEPSLKSAGEKEE